MINSIPNAVQTQVAVEPATVPLTASKTAAQPVSQPAAQPASQGPAASVPVDTVQISSTAVALSKELTETSVQTAKEAGAGDIQAQKLVAKQAAARM